MNTETLRRSSGRTGLALGGGEPRNTVFFDLPLGQPAEARAER